MGLSYDGRRPATARPAGRVGLDPVTGGPARTHVRLGRLGGRGRGGGCGESGHRQAGTCLAVHSGLSAEKPRSGALLVMRRRLRRERPRVSGQPGPPATPPPPNAAAAKASTTGAGVVPGGGEGTRRYATKALRLCPPTPGAKAAHLAAFGRKALPPPPPPPERRTRSREPRRSRSEPVRHGPSARRDPSSVLANQARQAQAAQPDFLPLPLVQAVHIVTSQGAQVCPGFHILRIVWSDHCCGLVAVVIAK